jgi:murein DD-endopeptidase MepM/ murein hydrolase activator NlpD
MAVSAQTMLRRALIGGLASMGFCLIWMGATTQARLQPHPSNSSLAVAAEIAPAKAPPAVAATPARPRRQTPTAALPVAMMHFQGTIHSSLFDAAMAQGVPAPLLHDMISALSYDVDFQRDIQPDDRFDLLAERAGDRKHPPRLLFVRLTLSGKPVTLYRFIDSQGGDAYYSAGGESARKALLKTPVDGARISSAYGQRFHPILHYTTQHKGIDFAVMPGTPVMAAGDGVVERAGRNGAYGLYLRISHGNDHVTAYAHLSRLAPGIRVGKPVIQGQTVGFSGSSGRSTGPHLHYEVLIDDQQINPMTVKFKSARQLSGNDLTRFIGNTRQTNLWLGQIPLTTRTAAR